MDETLKHTLKRIPLNTAKYMKYTWQDLKNLFKDRPTKQEATELAADYIASQPIFLILSQSAPAKKMVQVVSKNIDAALDIDIKDWIKNKRQKSFYASLGHNGDVNLVDQYLYQDQDGKKGFTKSTENTGFPLYDSRKKYDTFNAVFGPEYIAVDPEYKSQINSLANNGTILSMNDGYWYPLHDGYSIEVRNVGDRAASLYMFPLDVGTNSAKIIPDDHGNYNMSLIDVYDFDPKTWRYASKDGLAINTPFLRKLLIRAMDSAGSPFGVLTRTPIRFESKEEGIQKLADFIRLMLPNTYATKNWSNQLLLDFWNNILPSQYDNMDNPEARKAVQGPYQWKQGGQINYLKLYDTNKTRH